MTRPYAEVIGDPIAHTKSPLIHNFWLAKLGIDAEYRACHVRADELEKYFTRRRGDAEWRGCNVTIPHKVAVMSFLDRIDSEAERISAVNTVTRDGEAFVGFNGDGPGFMEPIYSLLNSETLPGTALVIGAGGAARAIVFALIDAGFQAHVLNRDPMRAAALLGDAGGISWLDPDAYRLRPMHRFHWYDSGTELGLFINATSLGMKGKPPLEFSFGDVNQNLVVYDIVYTPLETPLLTEARLRGLGTIDGLQMLVGQAAAAFELFFGQPAPREHDAELRALLTR